MSIHFFNFCLIKTYKVFFLIPPPKTKTKWKNSMTFASFFLNHKL